jgi:hypothetical protein
MGAGIMRTNGDFFSGYKRRIFVFSAYLFCKNYFTINMTNQTFFIKCIGVASWCSTQNNIGRVKAINQHRLNFVRFQILLDDFYYLYVFLMFVIRFLLNSLVFYGGIQAQHCVLYSFLFLHFSWMVYRFVDLTYRHINRSITIY